MPPNSARAGRGAVQVEVLDDVRLLALRALVDSAAMFPPARESLAEALAGYATASAADQIGLYGRFLVPAAAVPEMAERRDAPSGLGVVLPPDAELTDVRTLADAVLAAPQLDITSVEVRLPGDPDGVGAVLAVVSTIAVRHPISVYLEIDPAHADRELQQLCDYAVPGLRVGAKVRCGGLVPAAFPHPHALTDVLIGARRRGLTLKATQGLHHPFRQVDPLTGALQHGFLNLIAALALADHGIDLAAVVAETDREAFVLDARSLRWRDSVADARAVRAARRVLVGFGSCSLTEPLDDLHRYGVLT